MIRLNAAYSKKLPGEQPYSSEGVSLSVEVELPDQVLADPHQFSDAVRRLFGQARAEVEQQTRKPSADGAPHDAFPTHPVGRALSHGAADHLGGPAHGRGSPLPPPMIRVVPPTGAIVPRAATHPPSSGNGPPAPASKRQLDFLISLAKRNGGLSPPELLREAGVRSLSENSRDQASMLIERFNGAGVAR